MTLIVALGPADALALENFLPASAEGTSASKTSPTQKEAKLEPSDFPTHWAEVMPIGAQMCVQKSSTSSPISSSHCSPLLLELELPQGLPFLGEA